MIRIYKRGTRLVVDPTNGSLSPGHENQLAFWGFFLQGEQFHLITEDATGILEKVSKYLDKRSLDYVIDESLRKDLQKRKDAYELVLIAKRSGAEVKEGRINLGIDSDLRNFLREHVDRNLRDHQYKSVLHLLSVVNGAIFSVPGSGKTTVVLTVFELLRAKGMVDALFVVGPPACFAPWREEYQEVFGTSPTFVTLAGGNIADRRDNYLLNSDSVCDLYLTSFQTLYRDSDHVSALFRLYGVRFFLVIDEAHYIKQHDGAWANAVLKISPYAERRCILTGTPFPKSYTDAFNLFDALWPHAPPITQNQKHLIASSVEKGDFEGASAVLESSVGPLFYRVRKTELGLAPQVFLDPFLVPMKTRERAVYDAILEKVNLLSKNDYLKDLEVLHRLQRARIIRLRQCLSYTKLLLTALPNCDDDLLDDDSLISLIAKYDDFETPGKIDKLMELVAELRGRQQKVVIWSNFVKSLELIRKSLNRRGFNAQLIYGATPLDRDNEGSPDLSRERIIREFVASKSGVDILVANPAACAESVSLHKTCSHAIYYDLSYNCAQYLQSLDRIHRVGGSENKSAYYYFLQYAETLDHDILENVTTKARRMGEIIDHPYPIYDLDMFALEEDVEAYRRLFANE